MELPHSFVETQEDIENMQDGFFAADELWLWADARMSGTKKNKFTTMVLSKSRKKNINIAYTAQYWKSVDIRIRSVTDFVCFPYLNEKETICRLEIFTARGMHPQRFFKFKTEPIFSLYNTNEEVKSLDF